MWIEDERRQRYNGGMKNNPLPRLDACPEIREALLPFCRLKAGEIWEDPRAGHRVGCLDASSADQVEYVMDGRKATLAIQDPPYNLVAFEERPLQQFIDWCAQWVRNTEQVLASDSSLYVWLGADQNDGFQPLPDFMIMMRRQPFRARSFITMRNQRGYGTQKNWMAVRQELLYYVKGHPTFNVDAEYTDIPKILRGYYKEVNGQTHREPGKKQVRQHPGRKRMGGYSAGVLSDGGERLRLLRSKAAEVDRPHHPGKFRTRRTSSSISSPTPARRSWPRKSTIDAA